MESEKVAHIKFELERHSGFQWFKNELVVLGNAAMGTLLASKDAVEQAHLISRINTINEILAITETPTEG